MEKNEKFGFFATIDMKGSDRVLAGEEVIDGISGLVSISQKGIFQKEERRALILTPTRVILYHNKLIGHSSTDFPLSKINNVVFDTNILHAEIKIHSGDDIIIMKKVGKLVGERFSKNLKARVGSVNNPNITIQSSQPSPNITIQSSQPSPTPQPTSAPQASNIDIADQIRKLADLKAQGFLTEEEFTAQKKKLLGL